MTYILYLYEKCFILQKDLITRQSLFVWDAFDVWLELTFAVVAIGLCVENPVAFYHPTYQNVQFSNRGITFLDSYKY